MTGVEGDFGPRAPSLYDQAVREADRHKWHLSERLGYDAGLFGWQDWWKRHWPEFCRYRRLEHLRGERRWREFDPETFGRFPRSTAADPLVERILDLFISGWENLDFSWWIHEDNLPSKQVIQVLEVVDINRSVRLEPRL